jgi:ketosteroid isomerase-like protein
MLRVLASTVLALGLVSYPGSHARADRGAYYEAEYRLKPEDDLAVRQVVARLNHALDAGDYKAYGRMFAPDGVFVSGFGNAFGPEQVEAALGKVTPFITNKRHVASDLVISAKGDQIVATSYLIVFERQTELK